MIYLKIITNEVFQTYGVLVYHQDMTTILRTIPNLTSNLASLTALVNKCNQNQLSLIHLDDVLEDFRFYLEYTGK